MPGKIEKRNSVNITELLFENVPIFRVVSSSTSDNCFPPARPQLL